MKALNFLFLTVLLLFVSQNKGQAAQFAYVTNSVDDTVSVIEVATSTVIDTITVGKAPL